MFEEKVKTATKRKRRTSQSAIHASYRDLPVVRIRGNQWNPRKSGFEGPKFDELVASIRQKGVIQPIVVRSIQEERHDYEIIAGERRHRAMSLVSMQDPARTTIPAIIRECSDEEAFEICFIENLQRQDLSEPEEALAFAEYVERKGQESVVTLAEKLGVSPRYVRKRVEIMRLPKPLLWAWRKEIVQYGHLEQFLRVADKKERLMLLKPIVSSWREGHSAPTVRDFKQNLDDASADLSRALFDKTKCVACAKNSETQRNLFGIGDDRARCLESQCYLARQKEWLTENWQSHLRTLDPQIDTNGIRFSDEVSYGDCEPFYYKNIPEKCLACESFVSVVTPGGDIRSHRACSGRKACRAETVYGSDRNCAPELTSNRTPSDASGTDSAEDKIEATGKAWHGEYFREEFFKGRIPEKALEIDPFDEKMIRLSLFAIVSSNTHIHRWFAERLDLARKPKDSDYGFFLHCRDIFPAVMGTSNDQLPLLLREAAIQVLMSSRTVMPQTRRLAATFLGIDLAAEWKITRDYLEKKTKSEIVSLIHSFKILDHHGAWKYAGERCGIKRKSAVSKLKKEELMGIILDSGIDLSGMVPSEILFDSAPAHPPGAEGTVSSQDVEVPFHPGVEMANGIHSSEGYTIDPEEEEALEAV